MAEWVFVEDGQIKEYHDVLPTNWRHVSGLNLSSDNLLFLKDLGWLPVTKVCPPYDPGIQQIGGYNYVINESDVTEAAYIVDLPSTHQPQLIGNAKIDLVRIERDKRLAATDWTQTVDVVEAKGEYWKTAWANYRQALRDIPSTYNNHDLTEVDWPNSPFDY